MQGLGFPTLTCTTSFIIEMTSIQIPFTTIFLPTLNAGMLSAIVMRFIYVAYILTIVIINYNQN